MDDDRKLLRAREAARIAGVTSARIYQAISAGELPDVKIAGYVLIDEADLRRWMERPKSKGGRPFKVSGEGAK